MCSETDYLQAFAVVYGNAQYLYPIIGSIALSLDTPANGVIALFRNRQDAVASLAATMDAIAAHCTVEPLFVHASFLPLLQSQETARANAVPVPLLTHKL